MKALCVLWVYVCVILNTDGIYLCLYVRSNTLLCVYSILWHERCQTIGDNRVIVHFEQRTVRVGE